MSSQSLDPAMLRPFQDALDLVQDELGQAVHFRPREREYFLTRGVLDGFSATAADGLTEAAAGRPIEGTAMVWLSVVNALTAGRPAIAASLSLLLDTCIGTLHPEDVVNVVWAPGGVRGMDRLWRSGSEFIVECRELRDVLGGVADRLQQAAQADTPEGTALWPLVPELRRRTTRLDLSLGRVYAELYSTGRADDCGALVPPVHAEMGDQLGWTSAAFSPAHRLPDITPVTGHAVTQAVHAIPSSLA